MFRNLALGLGFVIAATAPTLAANEYLTPFPAHHVIANIYYVGSKGQANYLITTPKGNILINSGLEGNVPMIKDSIAKLGFKEMQVWNTAPTLTGKFVSIERQPRKRFFDLAPEAIRKHLPDDPTRSRELYRVDYNDPQGRTQSANLEPAEFYVPPREPGTEVDVVYVAGNPPRVKGPSRARDAAFIEYMPWAIAVGLFYLVIYAITAFLPRLLRVASKAVAPPGGAADPDRPEIR